MLHNTQLVIMHFLLIRPSAGLPRSASGYSISSGLLHTCHSGRKAPQGIHSLCDRQCSVRRDCQIFTIAPSFSAQLAHCYRYPPLTAKESHVATPSISELRKYTPAKGSHDKDGERKNCEQIIQSTTPTPNSAPSLRCPINIPQLKISKLVNKDDFTP